MKVLNKKDLITLLPLIRDRELYSLRNFEALLDRFGDEYFIVDGRYAKVRD